MRESHDSHPTSELVSYDRVKRRFLNLNPFSSRTLYQGMSPLAAFSNTGAKGSDKFLVMVAGSSEIDL